MLSSKFVSRITVIDPDTNMPVDIEIHKLESGGMIGIDASFFETDLPVFSPYDLNEEVEIEA